MNEGDNVANAGHRTMTNPTAPTEAEADVQSNTTTEAVLALAQKLHDEYVSEGQETRERLISEGQSRRDLVIGEATQRQEHLLSTGQAKFEEFVSAGKAKRDAMIAEANAKVAEATAEHKRLVTEARELSTAMMAEAQQRKDEVLHNLGVERASLRKDIDERRTSERNERIRQKTYIQGRLIALDESGDEEAG